MYCERSIRPLGLELELRFSHRSGGGAQCVCGVLSCADGEAVPGRCLGLAAMDGGWAEKKVWMGLCRQIHVLLFQVTRLKMGREGEQLEDDEAERLVCNLGYWRLSVDSFFIDI